MASRGRETSEQGPAADSSFGAWMGSMWLYTTLRFGLFFGLWAIFGLLGLSFFLGAFLALVLSVPLSLVLLARPRARFARQIEMRVQARQVERHDLYAELEPDADARSERD